MNATKLLSRFSKGSLDGEIEAAKKRFEATGLRHADLLGVAKLYGFTSAPPRPGDTAAWTSKDWVEWCDANNMKTVEKAKRGLKISHYSFPWLTVCPSDGGDFRGAMNCAADFRKLWTSTLTDVRTRIKRLADLAYIHYVRFDRKVPSTDDIIDLAAQFNNADVDEIFETLNVPITSSTKEEDTSKINTAKVYAAITYIARAREPQISYANAVRAALNAVDDKSEVVTSFLKTEEGVDTFVQAIARGKKSGDDSFDVPTALATIAELVVAHADVMRDAADVERAARSAEREAERAARLAKREQDAKAAEKTTADRIAGEIKRAKDQLVDAVSRFNHEISSIDNALGAMRNRVSKTAENMAGLRFDEINTVLSQQTAQLDSALSRIKVLEETVDNYVGSLQAIAELLSVDPKSNELTTKIKDAIADKAMDADVYRQRLMEFATEVHTAVSAKEFLQLAGNISKLLPKAEALAITAGDE